MKSDTTQCPKCLKAVTSLKRIEPGMRLTLQDAGLHENLPDSVCMDCYDDLASQVSFGAKLRVERKTKEKNRLMLWKNRVSFIRQGRQLMAQQAFSEAAVAYEKYLRILELTYEVETGQLTPSIFNTEASAKEKTVIASIYWDLVRIYDTSDRYGERQIQAAQKLAEFLPETQTQDDVIKRAENMVSKARNPQVIRGFLKQMRKHRSRCFIATAVFGSHLNPNVITLCRFRDEILLSCAWGTKLVQVYYFWAPSFARGLQRYRLVNAIMRKLLVCIVKIVEKHLRSPN